MLSWSHRKPHSGDESILSPSQVCYNPLWLTGLKAPTNYLTNSPAHHRSVIVTEHYVYKVHIIGVTKRREKKRITPTITATMACEKQLW